MAKASKIRQNEKRKAVVERYAARRAELKEVIRKSSATVGATATATATGAERQEAMAELRKQPRNASATRVRNRDSVDGRPRGYFRKFGLSRVRLRQQAHAGFLPGVTKSSW
ncbi:30S ribosomal protein S14 [Streptomyces yangpuensis]